MVGEIYYSASSEAAVPAPAAALLIVGVTFIAGRRLRGRP